MGKVKVFIETIFKDLFNLTIQRFYLESPFATNEKIVSIIFPGRKTI